jgi:hypothetical protein
LESLDLDAVFMTKADDEQSIDACYNIGANTCEQKPLNWPGFLEAVMRLKESWFEIAELPKSGLLAPMFWCAAWLPE